MTDSTDVPRKGLVRLMRTCAAEQASGYGDDKLSGALYGQPRGWPLSFLRSTDARISCVECFSRQCCCVASARELHP